MKQNHSGTTTNPLREYGRYVSYHQLLEDPLKWVGKRSVRGIVFALYMALLLVLYILYYYHFRPWIENS